MKTAWLFLGDIADRAGRLPLPIRTDDIVLLGPSRPMLKPICQWQGSKNIKVDVLGQEELSKAEMDEALLIVIDAIKILKELGHDYDSINRPWWQFRGIYLSVSLTNNALGKIALKKWLLRRNPEKVVVIREYGSLSSADFSNAFGDGPDNVLSFVAVDLCKNLGLPYEIIHYDTLKHRIKYFWYVNLYSNLVSYARLIKLPLVGLKERLLSVFKKKQQQQGNVIFFSRGQRFTELFYDLIRSCPVELSPKILFQESLTKEKRDVSADIPIVRIEKYSRFRDVLETIFRRSQYWYPDVSQIPKPDDDPLAPGYIHEYLKRVSVQARSISPYQKCVARTLSSLKPCLIISGDDLSFFTHTVFELAQSLKIPTISIQHGDYSAAVVTVCNSVIEDLYLSRTEEVKKAFISKGVSENKIALYTPQSLVNLIRGRDLYSNTEIGLKKVLIVGTRLGASGSLPLLIKAVSLLLKNDPDVTIEYRPHPAEPILNYKAVLESQGLQVKILPVNEPLSSQLEGVCCTLVFNSSVALHVAIMGMPVVVYTNEWLSLGYNEKVFIVTHSVEDAVQSVFNLLTDEELRHTFYKNHSEFITKIKKGLVSPEGDEWWFYIRKRFEI